MKIRQLLISVIVKSALVIVFAIALARIVLM